MRGGPGGGGDGRLAAGVGVGGKAAIMSSTSSSSVGIVLNDFLVEVGRGGEGGRGLAWRRRVWRALCGFTVGCLETTVFDLAEGVCVALEERIVVMSTSSDVRHA